MPTAAEAALARESGRLLAAALPMGKASVRLRMIDGTQGGVEVVVPASAFRLLVGLLAEMAQGNSVDLLSLRAKMTTRQAADLLNVSRPFFIVLLDEGRIPFRRAGLRRRVAARDVLAFKRAGQGRVGSHGGPGLAGAGTEAGGVSGSAAVAAHHGAGTAINGRVRFVPSPTRGSTRFVCLAQSVFSSSLS